MSDNIFISFARKPTNIDEVRAAANDSSASSYEIEVTETKQLSTREYDYLIVSFLKDREWLEGKGGFKYGIRQVVEVNALERPTLYIDPSGSAYARYVGMRVDKENNVNN